MDRSGKLSALWECGYYASVFGHSFDHVVNMDDETINTLFDLFQHNKKRYGLYSASPEYIAASSGFDWESGYNAWVLTQAAIAWQSEHDRLVEKTKSLVDKFLRSR